MNFLKVFLTVAATWNMSCSGCPDNKMLISWQTRAYARVKAPSFEGGEGIKTIQYLLAQISRD